MTLREKRIEFTRLIATLVLWAFEQGMHICFDREDLLHKKKGNHYKGLAKDVILYSDTGDYLTHVDHYRALGEKWKTMHPLARWGGDFKGENEADGGHFSFFHDGVQ